MIDETLDYRFLKVKNGKPFFAVVNLEISPNENKNEILEDYDGEGWKRIGEIESVPNSGNNIGYSNWKKAVIKGLEFVFFKTATNWTVKVKKVEGRIATDTNPTIVGYVTILAFCKQINLELNPELNQKIEDFVFNSWQGKNDAKVPNFITLMYEL